MKDVQRQLLQCMTAYRQGRSACVEVDASDSAVWSALYTQAAVHKLEGIVFETLRHDPAFCSGDRQMEEKWKRTTLLQAARQAARTQGLLRVARALEEANISYVVVKGVVCRGLYRQPELRPSGDEDILIHAQDEQRCGQLLERLGLRQTAPGSETEPVAHWLDDQTGFHLELHTRLLPPGRREEQLNDCFLEQLQHTVPFQTEGGTVQTLSPTWHMLFLIYHAMKHFIYGGFGIRTLCDVITYYEKYRDQIDQELLCTWLDKSGGRVFFDQVLVIARDYLEFDLEQTGWTLSCPADAEEMLEDVLEAGVYGQSTMSRRHSNNMVVHAAQEGKESGGLLQTLFPSRKKLTKRYPILEQAPVLLPAVWLHRLGGYGLEVMKSGGKENSPAESVSLGKKRIEMMIKYGIISKDN